MAKPTSLGKKILELRKKLNMTQTELAQHVGVSKGAISHFEKSTSKPSSETLTKLSQTLGEDLRKELPRIGRFPIQSTDNNIDVAIISGNKYNRLKWDYLRRNESDIPNADEEASYSLSKTTYAYESLSLPPSLLEEGQYIVCPIPSNNMAPTFEEGDLLLCGLVDKHDWDKIEADTDDLKIIDKLSVYVVEVWNNKERSIHFGRLSFSAKRQTFRCYQDDRSIPYRIPVSDVKFLWKFRWCLTNRFYNKSQELLDKIRELEQNVSELRGTQFSAGKDNDSNDRTYRERLRDIIVGQHIAEGEFLKGDYIDLANDNEVQQLYVREYGPIQNYEAYMQLMEKTILNMVRALAPEVQKSIAKNYSEVPVGQKRTGFVGDFRDDLRLLLQDRLKKTEDLSTLNQIGFANESKVKKLFVNEYGPIVNNEEYLNKVLKEISSVAFELSLGFPYVPDDKDEQNAV